MSSYLEGARLGADLVQGGFDEFNRARQWSHKLTEEKAGKELAAAHYEDERGDKEDAAARADDAESYKEDHANKQDELIDAEIDSIKNGTGRWNTPPGSGRGGVAQIPPEVKAAMMNRDNARKSISALAAGGIVTPPPEMQAKLDAAEGALSRVAAKNKFDLGEDASSTAAFHQGLDSLRKKAQADADAKAHPIVNWFKSLGGAPAPAGQGSPGAANGKPAWMQYDTTGAQ
jgi:hypothetical protein